MGFYEFRRQLEYKCKLYDSELIIVDRWFPSSKTCSSCGTVKESLLLSERVMTMRKLQF
ncbi:transposase [Okeania sp. SIO3I5]|uniref:transposase n=1 Tax=Okeania sp. SIO3I5 TaxID=2607805 RepID=UPI0025E828D9|nr:transposase [Okeania sp. SIO3I5]